nr:cupin domain-containing protein [Anaerolineae bacterium]
MTKRAFIKWQDSSAVEALPGLVRRTLGITDAMMVVEWRSQPNVEIPAHSHPHEQVGYCVSGEIVLTVDGQAQHLKPGDSWAIPGGVTHSAVFPVESIVIDCFSPPREDYV